MANPVFPLAEVRIEFMHEMIGSHYGWAATRRAPSIFRETIFDTRFPARTNSAGVHTQWRPSRI